MEKVIRVLAGSFDELTNPEGGAVTLVREFLDIPVADGGTAGTGVAAMPVHYFFERALLGATPYLVTPVNVATAASNNATFNVIRYRAGVATTVATVVTTSAGTGTITAFIAVPIPFAAVDRQFEAGDVLAVSLVKNASGVAVGAATASAIIHVDLVKN
jgi:hypothetical protein